MRDVLDDFWDEVVEIVGYGAQEDLSDLLREYNLMVVPIEDPTNLMGPIDE